MNTRTNLTSAIKHPLRRLRRFCRVLRGRDLWCRREIQIPTERFGSEYGGWTVWPKALDSSSVVYSFGVGEDISFDLGIISRFGCKVHAFDPTPRSIDWVRRQTLPEEFHFHEFGLGNKDGLASFDPPADPTHVSYSMSAPGSLQDKSGSFPVRRLQSIATDLRHDAIDLLKMDIEGAEYDALEDLLHDGPKIGQLLVEFHHRRQRQEVARTRDAIARLREAGYMIFDVSPSGEEYSFVHEDALTPNPSLAYEQRTSIS